MKCIVCNESFSFVGDKSRKLMYCSLSCRSAYYHKRNIIKDVERGKYHHFTVAHLERLGFEVKVILK